MGSDCGDGAPPDGNRGRAPDGNHGRSPDGNHGRSPDRSNGRSSDESRSRSPDESRSSQSEKTRDHSDRSSNTSPARYRNLWGMGIDPRRGWPDQQASTSRISHSEIERERLSKMQAVKDWIEESVTWNVFENTRAEDLPEELAIAKSVGVKPMHVDDPGFGKVANEEDNSLKWVVTESGDLLFVPHAVGGREIAHTVLTQGGPVAATGEAVIAVDGNERLCIEITNHSGHYLPDERSLEIGKQAFKAFGITFLGETKESDDGNGDGNNGGHDGHHGGHDGDNGGHDGHHGGNGGGDDGGHDVHHGNSDADTKELNESGKALVELLNEIASKMLAEEATAHANRPEVLVTSDLRAVRAAYPALDKELIQIEEKLCAQGQADQLQVIESVSQQQRILGFGDWVAESAGRDAERMLDKVMELAEAQRLLQEHLADPSVIVRVGQDAHIPGRSFDITVERPGDSQILRQIEVYTPASGIKRGHELISGIAHAAEKIPLGVRDGTVSLPPGDLEATIAVPWPPAPVRMGGDAERVYDTHGEYTLRSITNPTATYGRSGNLLKDTVDELNQWEYHNPVEFVTRLTVIDQTGQAIFELTNTTPPNVRPAQWTWRDLQGQ